MCFLVHSACSGMAPQIPWPWCLSLILDENWLGKKNQSFMRAKTSGYICNEWISFGKLKAHLTYKIQRTVMPSIGQTKFCAFIQMVKLEVAVTAEHKDTFDLRKVLIKGDTQCGLDRAIK